MDIESKPLVVYTWGLFNQNIAHSKVVQHGGVLCWAAKWLGNDEILFDSTKQSSKKKMLKRIHKLLQEADVVCHYNGKRFDIPMLNKEFLLAGMSPPAPYQQIDLLQTARKQFRFPSNKLDYIAKALGLEGKTKHAGHELWEKCMAGDSEAWATMEEYNKNDVVLLEQVYQKLLPWITNHPSYGLYHDGDFCPNCGGVHLVKRGFYYTTLSKYQRYRCSNCGTWSRSRASLNTKKKNTIV